MNPPRRGTPDFLLLFLTFALAAFGLLMVYSSSSAIALSAEKYGGDSFYFAKRHAIAMILGLFAMIFIMNVRYRMLRKWTLPIFLITVVLLALVPFIGYGPPGARSWLALGPFNLQPSEFAKLAIVLYLANMITRKGDKLRDFKNGLLPSLIIVGFVGGLIMMQPDLGSCAILVLGAMTVIIVGGANLKHLAALGAVGAGVLGIALGIMTIQGHGFDSYRFNRFRVFMDPWSDPLDTGFQIIQSLYAFGHGGFTGAGFGQSIQKLHYLPEAHNDFIFAIIGEEFGFLGTSLFLLIYILFLWRGIIVSLRCPDPFGMLVGIGIISTIGIQALVNIGGVTNSIPMTGITLPFISYGGSSILATLIGMGIVLGISRQSNERLPETSNKRS
ncbi:putative lipid II flippase FtsW [Paenibacillus sp. J2TS4]|uniref:putative lipid II flippase FtsW n=1 Tax=Paenibacillus sp. J2TS4 TaxID=2807194 RepID=UPI001B105AC1|nr:putative lipid II flippase FtsW [Paenibacillus sp. J2TS4]GIP32919.1 stage V sporulation protein E [Paenibacillus sp. J2TS4]